MHIILPTAMTTAMAAAAGKADFLTHIALKPKTPKAVVLKIRDHGMIKLWLLGSNTEIEVLSDKPFI